MSELKEVYAFQSDEIESLVGNANGNSYYLKSEADKVIARNKYKRCLAMAKWCFTKSNYHFVLARHGEDAKKNNRKSILYSKWHRRWLAIAEKFKEGVCRG